MKISNDTLAASGKLYDMTGADSLCKRPAWRKARCALHMKLEPEFTGNGCMLLVMRSSVQIAFEKEQCSSVFSQAQSATGKWGGDNSR